MSAPKFSPGPWFAGLPADGGRINVYTDDSMSVRVCRVDGGDRGATNARLIAALPLLYEALRLYVEHDVGARLGTPRYLAALAALAAVEVQS